MAKCKLTTEVKKEICTYVEDGLSFKDACYLVGIDERTIYYWLQKGKEAKSGIFFRLFQGIRAAEARAKHRRIKTIKAREEENADFALEMLARKYPEEFGKKEIHVEHGGTVEHKHGVTPELKDMIDDITGKNDTNGNEQGV